MKQNTNKLLNQINNQTLLNAKNLLLTKDYLIKNLHYSYTFDTINVLINNYNVTCSIQQDNILDFNCQCIIGKNHIICKHVAASILIYLDKKQHKTQDALINDLNTKQFTKKQIDLLVWIKNTQIFYHLFFKNTKLNIVCLFDQELNELNKDYSLILTNLNSLNVNNKYDELINKIKALNYNYELSLNLNNNESYLQTIDFSVFFSYQKISKIYFNDDEITYKYKQFINNGCFKVQLIKNDLGFIIHSAIINGVYLIANQKIFFFILENNQTLSYATFEWNDQLDPNAIFKLNFNTKNFNIFLKKINELKNKNYFHLNFINDDWLKNYYQQISFYYHKELNQCCLMINNKELINKYFHHEFLDFKQEMNNFVFYTNNLYEIDHILKILKKLKSDEFINLEIDPLFYKKHQIKYQLQFNLNKKWIDLKIKSNVDQKILNELYKAYKQHQRFKIIDDQIYDVDAFNFALLQKELNNLQVKKEQKDDLNHYQLNKANLFYLQKKYHPKNLNDNLKAFYEQLDEKNYVYNQNTNILKDYQLYGINWMINILKIFHGCILADEMGLGKTIQIIFLLQYFYCTLNLSKPTLIIVPSILIKNWINEFKKFNIDLNIIEIKGEPKKRQQIIKHLQNKTIYITSYNLINYDFNYLYEQEFLNIILDEGQNIKNINSHWTKKISNLKAINRIVVSGTPIENNLLDIWSLFNFIIPNYLWDLKTFKELYINQQNEDNLYDLNLKIKPFILQRYKKDLLNLPSKNIENIYLDLDEQARKYYDHLINLMNYDLTKKDHQNKIYILSLITKLRMFCCSPSLLNKEEFNNPKFDSCFNLIKNIIKLNNQNKIVVFSNYSSALNLLKQYLKQKNVHCLILTGKTNKNEREEIINHFKNVHQNVLLMSLKVGGVGINLNFANNIIILNPWWNDASELQAIDRLHRIGQERDIHIYKLIIKNTIEENMQTLKQNKNDLINKTLNSLSYEQLINLIKNH